MEELKDDLSIYDKPLGTRQIIGYNMGKAMEVLMISTLANIALAFYSISLKVNPVWLGAVVALPRFLDAVTDVVMGFISDNTKSRWGRRRPWMLGGGLLAGLMFGLIWSPPASLGEVGLLVYFLVSTSLFYCATTMYFVPYYALGNEISMDHDIRVRVMSYRSLVWGAATIVTPWAYRLFYCPLFGRNEIEGARVVGSMIGLICMVFTVISVLSSRENPAVMKQAYIPIKKALTEAAKCRPFWNMLGVATLGMLGFALVGGFNMFVGTYHVFNGDRAAMAKLWGYVGMTWGISAVVFSSFIARIIKRIGDKPTLYLALFLLMIGSLSSWWAYNPRLPILAIFTTLLTAPGVIGVQTVTFIWLTGICDYDEATSRKRKEGVFSSVLSFVNKSVFAVAAGFAGVLAGIAGVDTSLPQQSAQTILNLRILFAFLPALFALLGMYFVWIYPLTREKIAEARRCLTPPKEPAE